MQGEGCRVMTRAIMVAVYVGAIMAAVYAGAIIGRPGRAGTAGWVVGPAPAGVGERSHVRARCVAAAKTSRARSLIFDAIAMLVVVAFIIVLVALIVCVSFCTNDIDEYD